MRSDAEVRRAIALLGSTFADGELRRFIWGSLEQEAGRASAMLQTLFWVVGADESDFSLILKYVELKLAQNAEKAMKERFYAQ